MQVKIGDKVLSGQYSGDEVKVDGNEYKIVSQDYILGIIE
jgi:chaperonin GroES